MNLRQHINAALRCPTCGQQTILFACPICFTSMVVRLIDQIRPKGR